MGYYTELKLSVTLNNNAPLDLLESMCDGTLFNKLVIEKFGEIPGMYSVADEPELPISHIFGKSKRWSQIFNSHTTIFNKETRELKINCDIKAYDSIYEHLLNWLLPYIISGIAETKGEDEENWITTNY